MEDNQSKMETLNTPVYAVIMAGGGGTRFWPRSRQRFPKQFLRLSGDRTLLQQALDRVEALVPPERTWVITSAAHEALVAKQLPEVPTEQIVGEPCGRDTAACLGLGAALIHARDPQAIMVATPADHVIEPQQQFRRALFAAVQALADRPTAALTFGIVPTFPSTGYGYIQRGAAVAERQGLPVCRVEAFREKPDAATAERYLLSGQYLWNSGIFCWKAATLLASLREQQPALHAALLRIAESWGSASRGKVFATEYEPLPRLSIDYAVMERARDALVVPAPFRWDDVGSWQALERMNPQDADGNTVSGLHAGLRTTNCLVVGEADRLIATAGVDNLVIVQDGDATLVADKRDEAAIKKLVEHLKQRGLDRYL